MTDENNLKKLSKLVNTKPWLTCAKFQITPVNKKFFSGHGFYLINSDYQIYIKKCDYESKMFAFYEVVAVLTESMMGDYI